MQGVQHRFGMGLGDAEQGAGGAFRIQGRHRRKRR